jgi:hypothetical protein
MKSFRSARRAFALLSSLMACCNVAFTRPTSAIRVASVARSRATAAS